MMESETPPSDSPAQEAGDLEVSSWRVSPDTARPEGNPMVTRSPQYPALEEQSKESGTIWYAVGRTEGSARASDYLRRAPYINVYGD